MDTWNILWLVTLSHVLAQDPIVNLPQGRIVGIKVYNQNSVMPIEIFYGIPYATSPTGRYRFSTPERHTGWRRTFFAHRMPPRCPQSGDNSSDSSEDCLFLNIWTTRPVDSKLQPVLVILYSHSWSQAGISLPCQELAAEGVTIVTVAYRLHLLGFFTLKSIAARGNLALLDQYLALVWIRENIAAFGGDPASVTLAGHSAGADSVLYHILSPRPVGLFQRAIIMSPRNIWQILDKNLSVVATDVEATSREVAKSLGCFSKSDKEILQCMRIHPAAEIINVNSNDICIDHFQPIPDDFLPDSEQYLPSLPSTVWSSSKFSNIQLDLLFGTTNLEAINYKDNNEYIELLKQSPSNVHEYAKTKVIPEVLRTLSLDRPEALPMLKQAIEWEYWNSNLQKTRETITFKAIEAVARMESSAKWNTGAAILAAKIARRVSRLFLYRYSQPSAVDLTGRSFNFTGCVHGADLIALLGDALMLQVARRPATTDEKRISASFRKYIVNFVKFGSPGNQNEWPRYSINEPYVHEICDIERTSCNLRDNNREVIFWLQYLPQLVRLVVTNEQSEQLTIQQGENRLRGGVFAMCGVSVTLLLLLLASIVLLHKRWAYRSSISEDGTHL